MGWKLGGLICALAVAAGGCSAPDSTQPQTRRPVDPPTPAAPQPVSDQCKRIVKMFEDASALRPGDMTRDGAVMFVDHRWTKIPFKDQSGSAECISHYLAGGQDQWIKKITFKNQLSGVVYGTIENTRYRSGE